MHFQCKQIKRLTLLDIYSEMNYCLRKCTSWLTIPLVATNLSGCLNDTYQEPQKSETAVPGSKEIPLYSTNKQSLFSLKVTDSNGVEALVSSNNVTQGNISVTNVFGEPNGSLNVVISGNASGRISLSSSDSSHVNLGIDASTSTLQFTTRALSKPSTSQEIYVTNQKETGTDVGKVSVTSSFRASYASAAQTIKIPLSCFADAGMDFTNVISPFALESSNNLNFDLSNIRIVTNSKEQPDVLTCDNTSTPLTADNPADSFRASKVFAVPVSGWASAITNWMTSGSSQLHWGHDHIRIQYDNAPVGQNGGLILATQDKSFKDVSNYIDDGVLQFMFNVSNYASHPTKRFQIQMESSSNGNSEPYFLPSGTADNSWVQIRVPLKRLFTRQDGSININALKHVDKPLSILPEWVEGSDSLQGMEFSVGSVQIVVP